MTSPKRPLHEILSEKLVLAPVGINTVRKYASIAEVMTILGALYEGKMKASDAHKIAETHKGLPDLLRSVGETGLAAVAIEVLADLADRGDEKEEKKSEETAA